MSRRAGGSSPTVALPPAPPRRPRLERSAGSRAGSIRSGREVCATPRPVRKHSLSGAPHQGARGGLRRRYTRGFESWRLPRLRLPCTLTGNLLPALSPARTPLVLIAPARAAPASTQRPRSPTRRRSTSSRASRRRSRSPASTSPASRRVAVPDARGVEAALVKPDKPQDGAVKVKLSAAADAPLGVRELRCSSPAGVTAPVPVDGRAVPAGRRQGAEQHARTGAGRCSCPPAWPARSSRPATWTRTASTPRPAST